MAQINDKYKSTQDPDYRGEDLRDLQEERLSRQEAADDEQYQASRELEDPLERTKEQNDAHELRAISEDIQCRINEAKERGDGEHDAYWMLQNGVLLSRYEAQRLLDGIKERESEAAALDIVRDLAAWSEKYPRSRVYSSSRQPEMDGELIKLEERAKELLTLKSSTDEQA